MKVLVIGAAGQLGQAMVQRLSAQHAVTAWTRADVDPLQAPQDLAIAKFEWEFFRSLSRVWNQAPRSFTEFPEFLHLVYQNRVLEGNASKATGAIDRDSTHTKRAA